MPMKSCAEHGIGIACPFVAQSWLQSSNSLILQACRPCSSEIFPCCDGNWEHSDPFVVSTVNPIAHRVTCIHSFLAGTMHYECVAPKLYPSISRVDDSEPRQLLLRSGRGSLMSGPAG